MVLALEARPVGVPIRNPRADDGNAFAWSSGTVIAMEEADTEAQIDR